MKPLSGFLFVSFLLLQVYSAISQSTLLPVKENIADTALIRKLNADDYGMKSYTMVMLKTGPNKITDTALLRKTLAGHLQNIVRLANEGKLVLAGPFLDGTELEGIFIFNVSTKEETEKLLETDPGIKTGLFLAEIHPWYGSAALQLLPDIHKTIQQKHF